jgi:hypothetical protein
MVPVTIWRTGAPLSARRSASFSVARSPTNAAAVAPFVVQVARSRINVSRRKLVFPEPGLDTRLTT